jgi:hypothetical protein
MQPVYDTACGSWGLQVQIDTESTAALKTLGRSTMHSNNKAALRKGCSNKTNLPASKLLQKNPKRHVHCSLKIYDGSIIECLK